MKAFPVRLNSNKQSAALTDNIFHRSQPVVPKIARPLPAIKPIEQQWAPSKMATTVLQDHFRALKLSPNRMLARDFIHDSLYNEDYGYFSKRAVIFSPPRDVNFKAMQSAMEFDEYVASLYREYDDAQEEEALQVWHTPTELFKPWYGYALANYILQTHREQYPAGTPLIIYEMGAGNGTLMCNILSHIRAQEPAIYRRMRYNIIEISKQLTERQEWNNLSRLNREAKRFDCIRIINKSIFDWDQTEDRPCYFIALEVIDNFAHDILRYSISSTESNGKNQIYPPGTPLQTQICIDPTTSAMEEEYELISDPLIQRYLHYRQMAGYRSPIQPLSVKNRLRQLLPFAPNVSDPEFLPTMQMYFLEILRDKFPQHRLLLSDFDSLPTEVPGMDAPVVQTRQRMCMIPCSTYLVTRGWFDIFFPTNFELMASIYRLLMPQRLRKPVVMKHAQFLDKYSDPANTTTRNGERPILTHFHNVKFLLT